MQPNYLAKQWRTKDLPPNYEYVIVLHSNGLAAELGYYDGNKQLWCVEYRGMSGYRWLKPDQVTGWWPIPAMPTNNNTTAQQPSDWAERCSSAVERE